MKMKRSAPLLVVLALAGCGKADNEPGPGGVTVGEARALDEAAEMIEAQRPPEASGAAAPEANAAATAGHSSSS